MQDPHDPKEAIKTLRAEFVRTSARRLAAIEAQLSRLRESPKDRAALQGLRSELRGFASLGKMNGFPKVSRLAQEGEARCGRVVRETSEEDLSAWTELVAAIRTELAPGEA